MARITIEEVYNGEKYGVMSSAMAEYLTNGRPAEYDERTWVEMLLVKHPRAHQRQLHAGYLHPRDNRYAKASVGCRRRVHGRLDH